MKTSANKRVAAVAAAVLIPGLGAISPSAAAPDLVVAKTAVPAVSRDSVSSPRVEPALVTREMRYCASLGPKPPGLPSTVKYSNYLARKFESAGLKTRLERFHLPRFDVHRQSISVVDSSGRQKVAGEAFAYSGTGTVTAEVVDVGTGREEDYAGKDVRGKIVMVNRNEAFHRTAQLTEVIEHGGRAMLYVSGVPGNLVQTGTVRFAQDLPSPIIAMTVGADDGAALRERMQSGPLTMRLQVDASRVDAVGRNVIGVLPGSTYRDKYIVVAGHYDNWHAGAVDNCSSMGSLLQIIQATKDLDPAYTIIFAAWDAEEIGLTGSYDFVRRHPRIIDNTVVNENLEMTSAATYIGDSQLPASILNLMFGTSSPVLNAVVFGAAARAGFTPIPTTVTGVRSISGGIIPTDLQPFYSRGVQGFSTFSSSPYYHTTEESPDKIDEPSHIRVTNYLTNVLTDLQAVPPTALELQEVPTVTISVPPRPQPGKPLRAVVEVTDPLGMPVEDVDVKVLVNRRQHWALESGLAEPLGAGRYAYTVAAGDVRPGTHWFTATVNEQSYRAEGYKHVRVAALR